MKIETDDIRERERKDTLREKKIKRAK